MTRPWIGPLIALVLALSFFLYLSPGRLDSWFDQYQYEELAGVLASKGVFGHAAADGIVAEPRRTIGYPLFLAGVIKLFGSDYPAAALIQAGLVAAMPLLVYATARDPVGPRAALLASLATALFVPFAYWASYAMTEVLATFFVAAGTVAFAAALRRRSTLYAIVGGAALGYAGLVRPTLAFAVVALAAAVLIGSRVIRLPPIPPRVVLFALFAGLAVGVVPQLAYTRANYGRSGLVAATPGFQIMVGYWQGVWPGRASAQVDELVSERASSERVDATARELGIDPARLSRYVLEVTTYGDRPGEGSEGYIRANDWALERAMEDIRADLGGFIVRGVTVRLPTLLAGSIPVRYEQINALPKAVLLSIWGAQAVLVALGLLGIFVSMRRGNEAALLGVLSLAIVAYTCAVHFPFWLDARYGLPAWPFLLLAAAPGGVTVADTVLRIATTLSGRRVASTS